ncbi:MAG: 50S ribosomal protein L24e [Thermoplasmata archaeon]
MPVKRYCSFCGKEIEPGTGKIYIKRDGTILHFCSSKCEKNMLKLRRVPKYVTWTKAYAEEKKMRIHMVNANDRKNTDNIKA